MAAMTQLRELYMFHLPLPVLKVLAERTEPLENLTVLPHPGVNWVSSNSSAMICECAVTSGEEVITVSHDTDVQKESSENDLNRAYQKLCTRDLGVLKAEICTVVKQLIKGTL